MECMMVKYKESKLEVTSFSFAVKRQKNKSRQRISVKCIKVLQITPTDSRH